MKHVNVNTTSHAIENVESHAASSFDAPTSMSEVCILMRRAADALEAAIAAIPAPLTPEPLPLVHPAWTTRQYAPTDWARLIPRDQEPEASPLFDEDAFKKRFRPGSSVEIYFGAGEGYKRVSQTLCMPFYKIGVTKLYGLPERFRAYKAQKYGSFWCDNGKYVQDRDFDDQFASYIRTDMTLSLNSPVRATDKSVIVTLPLGMSQLDFEKAFRAAIAHCAVHTFLQSDDGLRHCRLINVDPQVGLRMTAYGHGAGRRMSPADEIYTIRPNRDGNALLTVVERIILRRLGLLD